MKIVIVSLLASVLVWGSQAAFGQEPMFGQALGKIYLSASPTEYQPNVTGVQLYTPFTVYLVTEVDYGEIGHSEVNDSVGIRAYEVGVNFPPNISVVSATIRNVSVRLGGDTNLIVGIHPPVLANQTPIDLVEYSLVATSGDLTDMLFTVQGTTPSSFGSSMVPGFNDSSPYLECHRYDGVPIECIRAYAILGHMSVNCVYNCLDPGAIPIDATSWSALKGVFRD